MPVVPVFVDDVDLRGAGVGVGCAARPESAPYQSKVFTWENVFAGRDRTGQYNAQIELLSVDAVGAYFCLTNSTAILQFSKAESMASSSLDNLTASSSIRLISFFFSASACL